MDMPPSSNKPNYNFWIIKLGKALASKEYEAALFCAKEAFNVAQTDTERAEGMNFKGDCLLTLQRYEEALQIYNNSLAQFQNDCKREAEPFLKEHIAKAFFKKMETLSKLERQAEIPSVYDEMVCRFGEDNTPFIRKYLAQALYEKASYFGHLAEKENSLAAYALTLYDELLQKFGNDTDTIIKQEVAWAMRNKSNALFTLERYDDAIKACDACIQKFGNETDIAIKREIVRDVVFRMLTYITNGDFGKKFYDVKDNNFFLHAKKTCDRLLKKFSNKNDIQTQKMLVIVRLIFYAQEVGWYDYELNKAYRHLSLAKDEAIKQWILPAIITEQEEFLRFSQSSDLGKFLEELYQSV